jgi:hypothetical protein
MLKGGPARETNQRNHRSSNYTVVSEAAHNFHTRKRLEENVSTSIEELNGTHISQCFEFSVFGRTS